MKAFMPVMIVLFIAFLDIGKCEPPTVATAVGQNCSTENPCSDGLICGENNHKCRYRCGVAHPCTPPSDMCDLVTGQCIILATLSTTIKITCNSDEDCTRWGFKTCVLKHCFF